MNRGAGAGAGAGYSSSDDDGGFGAGKEVDARISFYPPLWWLVLTHCTDSRGTMFSQVMKFVNTNTPRIVLLENVSALLTHDKGNSFATIVGALESEGYTVVHKILKCSDYGIPQMRKRLFIVGFKNVVVDDVSMFFELAEFEHRTTLKDYLGKNFKKDTAYTIRCGGKNSAIGDRHNWDGYWVDDKEYRLTIEDALKLQALPQLQIDWNSERTVGAVR